MIEGLSNRDPIERTREISALETALDRADRGSGSLVMIEGPPGIGKSRLLAHVSELATGAGIRAPLTRGSSLDSGIPFGIAHHLFSPLVAELSEQERDSALSGAAAPAEALFGGAIGDELDTAAMCNAIYWLTSNLAEDAPLALIVDDAQLADPASLTALNELARRASELPVLLVIAVRAGPKTPGLQGLEQAAWTRGNALLQPDPLTSEGVGEMLSRSLGQRPAGEAVAAAREVTDGNPYLLVALTRTLGEEITAKGGARSIRELGPEALGRATLRRIETEDEWLVTRAAAVLGADCSLRDVVSLTALEGDRVSAAADALAAASILKPGFPIDFIHPTVAEAVLDEIAPGERSSLHARAAEMLAADGASPDRAAVHLLETEPSGEPGRIPLLSQAAKLALARGAPAAAAPFLKRALSEPPAPGDRTTILAALGRAQALAGDPEGIEHLRRALEASEGAVARSRAAMVLGKSLAQMGRPAEARGVFTAAREELGDEDPNFSVQLVTGSLLAGMLDRRRSPELEGTLEQLRTQTGLPGELAVAGYGTLAWTESMAGESATTTRQLAVRSMSGGITSDMLEGALFLSITALISTDSYEEAERYLAEAIDAARSAGVTHPYSMACAVATYLNFRWGRLSDAVGTGENALEICRHAGLPWGMPVAPGWLAHALVERGELDAAEGIIADHDLDSMGENPAYDILRHARGALREARGDYRGALSDFLAAGRGQTMLGALNPSLLPWRSSAGLAALRLGEKEEAERLTAEEVELATRFGAPRALGVALCARGTVLGGDEGLSLIQRSIEVLDGVDAPVARAHSLVAAGSALRRAGLERQAREPLRDGMHLASVAGAVLLAERARDELVASGARPRRMALAGPDSLTPSEARIAALAAGGRTNRAIAQDLFLSVKTVEFHLRNGYRKLGISSRADLAEALSQASKGPNT